jgi:hypothetical protein
VRHTSAPPAGSDPVRALCAAVGATCGRYGHSGFSEGIKEGDRHSRGRCGGRQRSGRTLSGRSCLLAVLGATLVVLALVLVVAGYKMLDRLLEHLERQPRDSLEYLEQRSGGLSV